MEVQHNELLGDASEFIRNNAGLVHTIAQKCHKKTQCQVDYEDLVQEGMIGLLKTYRLYDGRAAVSTFAFFHIRNQMLKYLRDKAPVFRIPTNVYDVGGKILRRGWTDKSPSFISEQLDCSLRAAEYALEHLKKKDPRSMHEVVGDSEDKSIELGETISSFEDFTTTFVNDFESHLPDKQKDVLGLILKGYTQAEIGSQLGFSQVHASRLLTKVRTSAREYFGTDRRDIG